MSGADQVPTLYFKAKVIIPDLPPLVVGPDLPPGSADAEARLDENGNCLIRVRSDYPPPALDEATKELWIENTVNHEIGHPEDFAYTRRGRDHHARYWAFRGFPGTWDDAERDAIAREAQEPGSGWQFSPRESWAECFGAALSGRWTKPEKTMNWGKPIDAMAARTFFRAYATAAPQPVPPAPPPPVTGAKVLWHLSHHSSSRPDGWSGAPDEARWIREDLTPRVVTACRALGIELVLVDGDMLPHPEYAKDYRAFVASHYESDTHDDHIDADTGHNTRGGWFWGRAKSSTTAADDDHLGGIFERRYRELLAKFPDGPDEHEDWMTINVLDYYGFRLTTAKTPGILPELGVGAPGDPNNDHDWLRAHVQEIADVFALSLAEFLGQEDDMFTDADRVMLKRVYDHLEAYEPLVWTKRLQQWLAKALKSFNPNTDTTGPDVESGQPFK